jgi:Domain of unknown function (DUF4902)
VSRMSKSHSQQPALHYSENGYIRLTYATFCCLRFPKRLLIEDDDLRRDLIDQELPAFCAGYCDWVDDTTTAQISIGWAWFISGSDASQQLAPGGLSSNIMFVSGEDTDLGVAKTNELLETWLSGISWRAFVGLDALGNARMSVYSVH